MNVLERLDKRLAILKAIIAKRTPPKEEEPKKEAPEIPERTLRLAKEYRWQTSSN
jgi:hypothetical protein